MNNNEIIEILKNQLESVFHFNDPVVEFEYEEDEEKYFNILVNDKNYVCKVNLEEGNIYWPKEF